MNTECRVEKKLIMKLAIIGWLELVKLTNLISDISLRFEEVYQALSTLQTKKACGPNGIGPSVLQACASPLTPILQHLFSLSLDNRVVPTK